HERIDDADHGLPPLLSRPNASILALSPPIRNSPGLSLAWNRPPCPTDRFWRALRAGQGIGGSEGVRLGRPRRRKIGRSILLLMRQLGSCRARLGRGFPQISFLVDSIWVGWLNLRTCQLN